MADPSVEQVDDEVPEAEEDEKQETDDDPEHDSLIKAPKKSKAASGKGKAPARSKASKT